MKIEHWTHEQVRSDGTCLNEIMEIDGAVGVNPSIKMSQDKGGCSLEHCKCSEGHWLMINFGRDEESETVSGVTVYFDNWGEMQLFLSTRELNDV